MSGKTIRSIAPKKKFQSTLFLRIIYKKKEKVSNLRYSPSSPYFYNFTVGASLCTILISSQS